MQREKRSFAVNLTNLHAVGIYIIVVYVTENATQSERIANKKETNEERSTRKRRRRRRRKRGRNKKES